jgi:hypothetical protein
LGESPIKQVPALGPEAIESSGNDAPKPVHAFEQIRLLGFSPGAQSG